MAKFSIIVPVYNVEKEIRRCLDSLKNQTFGEFEVFCVDDCGSDSSMKIVEEFVQNDDRFKILHHEHNKGVSAARNTGLDNVHSEYVMFVDSDDWLELNALEVVYNAFKETMASVVMFDNYECYPDKEKECHSSDFKDAHKKHLLINDANLEACIGVVWNRAYKTSLINDNNIRFPEGMIVEDSDFNFKVCMHIKDVYILNTPLYNYSRNREGSYTTEDKVQGRINDEITVISNCWNYAKSLGCEKKFRRYFLKLIGVTTKKILGIKYKRRYILSRIRDILKEMNFPDDFKDIDNSGRKILTLWMD